MGKHMQTRTQTQVAMSQPRMARRRTVGRALRARFRSSYVRSGAEAGAERKLHRRGRQSECQRCSRRSPQEAFADGRDFAWPRGRAFPPGCVSQYREKTISCRAGFHSIAAEHFFVALDFAAWRGNGFPEGWILQYRGETVFQRAGFRSVMEKRFSEGLDFTAVRKTDVCSVIMRDNRKIKKLNDL